MKWQEYQEAVAMLYEQTDGFGDVRRNVMVPDTITGQVRQVDVLIDIDAKGHRLKLMVDAKFHSGPIDVRDVESALALATAVGANKAIIVAANGWTAPAKRKADHTGCDLILLSIDDALDLIVPDKWTICPACNADCIVIDQDGATDFEDGTILWWLAGQCRACKCARIHCQACGAKTYVGVHDSTICGCGHRWSCNEDGVDIDFFAGEPVW